MSRNQQPALLAIPPALPAQAAADAPARLAAFREFGGEAAAFIIGANLHRRHLSESQRAAVGAELATLPDGVRKDRQGAQICAPTQPEAAKLLNVSRRSVQEAKAVKEAAPELFEKVKAGAITVHQAKRSITKAKAKADNAKAVLEASPDPAAFEVRYDLPVVWEPLAPGQAAMPTRAKALGNAPGPPYAQIQAQGGPTWRVQTCSRNLFQGRPKPCPCLRQRSFCGTTKNRHTHLTLYNMRFRQQKRHRKPVTIPHENTP